MQNLYIEKDGKNLRCGFTTGSCAAAAAKAALIMLLGKNELHNVQIMTPKGIVYHAEIVDIERGDAPEFVSCAVVKDGGDDPDVTSGSKIVAMVALKQERGIVIQGGDGVGIVTKPGLDQPVGEAAINRVPRQMITENVTEVLQAFGRIDCGAIVTISVLGGEALAAKTFNPKLGITGGISILGTTGIVEPMSDEAILQTIAACIRVRSAEGTKLLLLSPGNYGTDFLSRTYGIKKELVVTCSNFVYDAVGLAASAGFKRLLFAGHIGKLVKVAGGVKNTHSMYGDRRMEILMQLAKPYMDSLTFSRIAGRLSECVMTDAAVEIINETGCGAAVFQRMADEIKANMERWSGGKTEVEVIVFGKANHKLAQTKHAGEWIKEI